MRQMIPQLELSLLLAAALATSPFVPSVSGNSFGVVQQAAFAKSGINGNGGGNGGGNGNGGANGGGNGNGGGKSETRGNSNSSGSKVKGATTGGSPAELSVRHDDGISEVVRNGRYIMKDSKERTIINRKATLGDEIRLRFFSR